MDGASAPDGNGDAAVVVDSGVGLDAPVAGNESRGQDVSRDTVGDQVAVGQHCDLVGELAGYRKVVEGGDHGQVSVGTKRGDQLEDLKLVTDVEKRGGFVEDQDRGVLGQCPSQDNPLSFAAGQRLDAPVGELAKVEPVEHFGGDVAVVTGW